MKSYGVIMNNLSSLLNSPMESGLRGLIILEAGYPHAYDISRIVIYDYLLVHSGDAECGPESIHPATPHRAGEMLVKRPILEQGVKYMMAKGLIIPHYTSNGIEYTASEIASPFLDSLQADYTKKLINVAHWVVETFDLYTEEDLHELTNVNLTAWGGEFINESIVRGGITS